MPESNDNSLQFYHTNHHSSPLSSTTSMLPVHSTNQLEIILPLSSTTKPYPFAYESTHSMTTRLKSCAIDRKNYVALFVSIYELHSLQITEEDPFTGGYSFLSEILDIQEPSSFRKASTIPQWQVAMQEDCDSLRAQGTWFWFHLQKIELFLEASGSIK